MKYIKQWGKCISMFICIDTYYFTFHRQESNKEKHEWENEWWIKVLYIDGFKKINSSQVWREKKRWNCTHITQLYDKHVKLHTQTTRSVLRGQWQNM